jgi:GNAT superfamily N-acetyltransferase
MNENQEWRRDEFLISTDHERIEIETIHHFLTTETYWAGERTLETVRRSFQNSLPFVIYKNEETIGFARIVSDFATFAWLADVFIRQEYRGLGLSRWLMEVVIAHPDLQGLRRFLLATRDAHGLYRQFGFDDLRIPYLWMERTAPNAYASFGLKTEQTES